MQLLYLGLEIGIKRGASQKLLILYYVQLVCHWRCLIESPGQGLLLQVLPLQGHLFMTFWIMSLGVVMESTASHSVIWVFIEEPSSHTTWVAKGQSFCFIFLYSLALVLKDFPFCFFTHSLKSFSWACELLFLMFKFFQNLSKGRPFKLAPVSFWHHPTGYFLAHSFILELKKKKGPPCTSFVSLRNLGLGFSRVVLCIFMGKSAWSLRPMFLSCAHSTLHVAERIIPVICLPRANLLNRVQAFTAIYRNLYIPLRVYSQNSMT